MNICNPLVLAADHILMWIVSSSVTIMFSVGSALILLVLGVMYDHRRKKKEKRKNDTLAKEALTTLLVNVKLFDERLWALVQTKDRNFLEIFVDFFVLTSREEQRKIDESLQYKCSEEQWAAVLLYRSVLAYAGRNEALGYNRAGPDEAVRAENIFIGGTQSLPFLSVRDWLKYQDASSVDRKQPDYAATVHTIEHQAGCFMCQVCDNLACAVKTLERSISEDSRALPLRHSQGETFALTS